MRNNQNCMKTNARSSLVLFFRLYVMSAQRSGVTLNPGVLLSRERQNACTLTAKSHIALCLILAHNHDIRGLRALCRIEVGLEVKLPANL